MSIEQRLQQAYEQQAEYQANDIERAKIAGATLLAVVGARGAGKNHLMRASGLHVVGGETNREPRADDDPALTTYDTAERMLQAIKDREYIQYGVHLPDLIYATRASHFKPDDINVKDIWFDAIPMLGNKGFKEVKIISILSPGNQWLEHIKKRFHNQSERYIVDSLTEAEHSVRWSLANQLARTANLANTLDHLVIINDHDHTPENVDRIQRFARGEHVEPLSDELVRDTAEEMFRVANSYHK